MPTDIVMEHLPRSISRDRFAAPYRLRPFYAMLVASTLWPLYLTAANVVNVHLQLLQQRERAFGHLQGLILRRETPLAHPFQDAAQLGLHRAVLLGERSALVGR